MGALKKVFAFTKKYFSLIVAVLILLALYLLDRYGDQILNSVMSGVDKFIGTFYGQG